MIGFSVDTLQCVCFQLAKDGARYLVGHILIGLLLMMFGVSSVYLANDDDYSLEPMRYSVVDVCRDPSKAAL